MRLLTYRDDDRDRVALEDDGGVLDAAELLGSDSITVRELLSGDRVTELGERAAEAGAAPRPAEEVELRPPLPDPDKIVCIGLNYRSHAAEAGIDPPDAPTIFAKFRNALVPAGANVKLPAASEKVDYEAEIAFVIGRRCSEVGPGEALEAVAGYMLFNDLSARDLQFATPQWMPGKVFDGSAPCGPALVTPDESGPHDAIEFKLELNGETMQEASTSDLVFSVPELISHLSRLMTLEPGDEIVISSPTLGRLETEIG